MQWEDICILNYYYFIKLNSHVLRRNELFCKHIYFFLGEFLQPLWKIKLFSNINNVET